MSLSVPDAEQVTEIVKEGVLLLDGRIYFRLASTTAQRIAKIPNIMTKRKENILLNRSLFITVFTPEQIVVMVFF